LYRLGGCEASTPSRIMPGLERVVGAVEELIDTEALAP
jgi:hypothetical protein